MARIGETPRRIHRIEPSSVPDTVPNIPETVPADPTPVEQPVPVGAPA